MFIIRKLKTFIYISMILLLLYLFVKLVVSLNNENSFKTILEYRNKDDYIDFSEFSETIDSENSEITRIIHQSWKTKNNLPPSFKRYMPSWKKCFPEWEHKFWTDKDNRNLIAKYYPWFLSKYDSFPYEIYRADSARYFYMFHYGGLYTDLDNECLRPFENLLKNYSMVFGDIGHVTRQTNLKDELYVQNSFMYSKPNQPIWLDILLSIYHSKDNRTAAYVTGPLVLCNTIQKYKELYPQTHGMKIYAAKYFNPITWGDKTKNFKSCKIYDWMTYTQYRECRRFHFKRGSYVVQYHTHVWDK